jgi:acetyl-CoA acetyltransferase
LVGTNGRPAIVGAGTSAIGQLGDRGAVALQVDAIRDAMEDAGLSKDDLDGLILRGPDDMYSFHQAVGKRLGVDPDFATTLDNGGASQALGVALACMAIEAGLCNTVVCGYARDGWARTRSPRTGGGQTAERVALVPAHMQAAEFGPEYGYVGAAAVHAMGARRYMSIYGDAKDAMGKIAVTFREYASRNPYAQKRDPFTLDDYHAARRIVDPFNVLDCSLLTDGAGAVVITSAERARSTRNRPVQVLGYGSANNSTGWTANENMVTTSAVRSGRTAFAMSGLTHEDIDFLQLYDCFTYMVLVQLEDYGFCAKGEGAAFVESQGLGLKDALPTNTSGGQLSEGHVEGMLQIVEAVRQLRHDHDDARQVSDASVGLVSGHGGNAVSHSTLILGS